MNKKSLRTNKQIKDEAFQKEMAVKTMQDLATLFESEMPEHTTEFGNLIGNLAMLSAKLVYLEPSELSVETDLKRNKERAEYLALMIMGLDTYLENESKLYGE